MRLGGGISASGHRQLFPFPATWLVKRESEDGRLGGCVLRAVVAAGLLPGAGGKVQRGITRHSSCQSGVEALAARQGPKPGPPLRCPQFTRFPRGSVSSYVAKGRHGVEEEKLLLRLVWLRHSAKWRALCCPRLLQGDVAGGLELGVFRAFLSSTLALAGARGGYARCGGSCFAAQLPFL